MSPRDERVLTLDKNPEALFQAWQKAGKVPSQFESFAQMEDVYNRLLETGLSEKAAREAIGATYRNVDGQSLLQKNIASDGSTRGLNKRAIRTDFNIGAENHLRNKGGNEAVAARQNEIRMDWKTLSKLEAQQLGIDTGKQFHRGHVVAGLEGGSLAIENMWPEHGMRNVLHGKEDRIPRHVIDELGIPKDDLFNIYERQLQAEGLGMPRVSNALMIAADEYMVQPQSSTKYTKPGDPNHDKGAGVNPDRLYAMQDRLNQLEAQGVSRQAIENYAQNQSGTLSRDNAVKQSGPVRQVVAPRNRPVTVTTLNNPRKVPPRLVPNGASPSMGPKVNKPTSKPPVGQQAKLNGKPVVWDGKTWKPVMPNNLRRGANGLRIRRGAAPTPKTVERTNPLKPGSHSQQIRRLQNSAQDALLIHPGMSLPSINLIRGI